MTARSAFQYNHLKKTFGDYPSREDGLNALGLSDFTFVMLRNCSYLYSSEKRTAMYKEYLHYLTEGTVWAEDILDIPIPIPKTVVNPTLFEHVHGMYTLHYALTHYNCFTHSFQYTPAEVGRTFGETEFFPGTIACG